MTIGDFVERVRTTRTVGPDEAGRGPSFIVYVIGAKEFFAGDVLAVSTDGVLLRQADGTEVLISPRHIVAVCAAEP